MFAIIILNYNSSIDVIRLVHQIHDANAHIIVVDNKSSDNSINDLRGALFGKDQFSLIESSDNGGYARGNNLGLKFAEEMGLPYAFVINPDVSIECLDVFDSCIKVIADTNSLACAPLINSLAPYYNRPRLLEFLIPPLIRLKDKSLHRKMLVQKKCVVDVYKLYGCFICFDIIKFKKIGYFDEKTFLYFEESIVAEKALQKSLRQVNIMNVSVRHEAQSSVKQLGLWQFKYFYSSCYVYLTQFRSVGCVLGIIFSLIDVSFRIVSNKLRGLRNGKSTG